MADSPISEELVALRKRARRRLVGAVALVLVALGALWLVMDNKPPASMNVQQVSIVSSSPTLATQPPVVKPVQETAIPVASLPASPASAEPVKSEQTEATATKHPAPVAVPTPKADVAPAAPASKPENGRVDSNPKPETKVAEPKPHKPENRPAVHDKAVDPQKILDGMASVDDHPPKPAASDKPSNRTTFYLQIGAFADAAKIDSLQAKIRGAGLTASNARISTEKGELTRLRAGPFASRAEAEAAQGKLASAGVVSQIIGK